MNRRWLVAWLALGGCDDEVVGFADSGSTDGEVAVSSSSETGALPGVSSSGSTGGAAGLPDFVVYGLEAGLAASFDAGASWQMVDASVLEGFTQETMIAGPDGLLLAGGYVMASSPDGLSWTTHALDTSLGYVRHLASNGTRWVSVGLDHLAWSEDGISWTDARNDLEGFDMFEVAYGGGRFVALGFDTMLTSTDGASWTKTGLGGSKLEAIAYANGRFVGLGEGGRIIVTANGEDLLFNEENVLPGLTGSVRACRGRFVAASEGALFFSDDGQTWTETPAPSSGLVACSEDSVVTMQGQVTHHGADALALASVFTFDGTVHALDYVGGVNE